MLGFFKKKSQQGNFTDSSATGSARVGLDVLDVQMKALVRDFMATSKIV